MWIYHVFNVWVVLVGLVSLVYYLYNRHISFWAKKGVPFKKPHLIYGNIGDFITKKAPMTSVLSDLYNGFKGERFGGVWEMFSPKLFVIDPDLLRDILVKDFETWSHRGTAINEDVDPLAVHLAALDGKKWKAVRTKLTPTFTSAKLKHMHYLLLECGEDFEKYLDKVAKEGKPVHAADMNAKFTTDVIGSCVFGIQMNSLNDEDALFRKMGKKMFESSARKRMVRLVQSNLTWLFKFLKLSTVSKEVSDFFLKIVSETFEHRDKNNIQRHDFVDLLRNLRNTGESLGKDELEFDDNLLAAQAFVFFGAGFETSSTTISYALHELAINQDIQERLRREVHQTKIKNNGEISFDSLKNMKYLDMVLRETLRKYPIASQVQRMSVKPYRIPDTDVVLPAGIKAIIPIFPLHHDPQYYPDPEKFDPERFTEEAKRQRPALTYIPFGDGPRMCIGMRFAEQQTKMAIVKVVDSFKVSLSEKSQNPIKFKVGEPLVYPELGIWLNISRNVLNPSLSDNSL